MRVVVELGQNVVVGVAEAEVRDSVKDAPTEGRMTEKSDVAGAGLASVTNARANSEGNQSTGKREADEAEDCLDALCTLASPKY